MSTIAEIEQAFAEFARARGLPAPGALAWSPEAIERSFARACFFAGWSAALDSVGPSIYAETQA